MEITVPMRPFQRNTRWRNKEKYAQAKTSRKYNNVLIFICLCVCLKQQRCKSHFSAVIITKSLTLRCCVREARGELGGSLQRLRFHSPGRCGSSCKSKSGRSWRFKFMRSRFTGPWHQRSKAFQVLAGSGGRDAASTVMSGPSSWPLSEIHYDFMAGWADFFFFFFQLSSFKAAVGFTALSLGNLWG